jgi:hypothetical protein
MRIYLDIDGPLIRDGRVTPHCFPFLKWAVELHSPYWLSTRDAHGTHDGILGAFRHALGTPILPPEIEVLIRAVGPTKWRGNKLTGIDFTSDWVWLDDDPLLVEIEALRSRGLLDRLLIVPQTMICSVLSLSRLNRPKQSSDRRCCGRVSLL